MKKYQAKCFIKDYPRPQLVRKDWIDLNGKWDFSFDNDNTGIEKSYSRHFEKQYEIIVPFPYQTKASGIGKAESVACVWYHKSVDILFEKGERIYLHIEGSDYTTQVFINGKFVGEDEGAYHRESFDITNALIVGRNDITMRILDDYSKEKPRGKQRSASADYGCWYVDMSGIYKTVWLEKVNNAHVKNLLFTPSVVLKNVKTEYKFSPASVGCEVKTAVYYQGELVSSDSFTVERPTETRTVSLTDNVNLWSVGDGKIYDVFVTMTDDGKAVDTVGSYFGLREITCENGKVLLNGLPLYQKLALDQGYFYESDLTAKSADEFEKDITTLLQMGFNGVRKHEKFEDERFFYLADMYGFIVWNEMPSFYEYTDFSKNAMKTEWLKNIKQIYDHPSILVLVLFNESWGIDGVKTDKEKQAFVNEMYYMTKYIDKTRPIITNDGWEHTISDILTMHHYVQSGQKLHSYFDTIEKCTAEKYADHDRGAFADGYTYNGQPIIISEFGGTSFDKDTVDGAWGYGTAVNNDEEFLTRFRSLIDAITSIPFICGYCYTQVTDVYSEVNGLMDHRHEPKSEKDLIAEILK